MSDLGKVERVKLLAALFNTLAAAVITIGVFGPLAAWVYGLSPVSVGTHILLSTPVICVCLAVVLHLFGQAMLTVLDEIDDPHS